MKYLFFILLLGCSPKNEKQFDDDYVLIEFASKLEEESLKVDPHEGLKIDGEKQGIRQNEPVE